MIEIKAILDEKINELIFNAGSNIDKYKNSKPFLNDTDEIFATGNSSLYLDENTIKEINNLKDPQNKKAGWQVKEDGDVSRLLFENLFMEEGGSRIMVSPLEASDRRKWCYLTQVVFWKYMQRRWPVESDSDDSDINKIKDRYLIPGSRAQLTAGKLYRNGISGLWWASYLTFDEGARDPYHLQKILFTKSDYLLNFMDRAWSHDKEILKQVLLFLKDSANAIYTKNQNYRFLALALTSETGSKDIHFLSVKDKANLVKKVAASVRPLLVRPKSKTPKKTKPVKRSAKKVLKRSIKKR